MAAVYSGLVRGLYRFICFLIIGEMMFDSLPELSSDLDWMLQSGQASNAMLARALVEEYYSPVYRLALGIFDDPETAKIVAQETFVSALLSVYWYRDKDGVQTWLFRIFFNTCRRISKRTGVSSKQGAVDPADPERKAGKAWSGDFLRIRLNEFNQNTRQIVLLRYLLGWDVSEISSVLKTSENTIQSQLKHALREILLSEVLFGLQAGPGSKRISDAKLESENLDQQVSHALQEYYPSPELSQEEMDREIEVVLSKVALQGARRRSFTSIKELLWVGLAALLVVGVIWGVNNLLPDEAASQALPVANAGKSRSTKTPTSSPTPLSVTRQAILPPTQEPLPTPVPADVFYVVQPGDTLELIATKLGVSMDELLSFNRIASAADISAGTRLVIPSSFPTILLPEATPVTSAPLPEPASPPTSTNAILQFLHRRSTNQSTLWVDAQIINYGPQGYVGPPDVSRNQLWMSDVQFLALHGPVNGLPQEVYLRKGGDLFLARPGIDIPLFFPMRGTIPSDSTAAADLNLLFNTLFASFPRTDSFDLRVVGSDTIAGRRTWMIEKRNSDSELENILWADTQTGFILRSQELSGKNQKTVSKEVAVTAIAYNVDFPQSDLFSADLPWRGGFAGDYTGKPEPLSRVQPTWVAPMGHEPLPYIPALGPFDPSHSFLTFQYPQTFSSTESLANVSLFADGFFLGKVNFGNPWTSICDRSPDGSKIAYVSQPFKDVTQNASLYWFSLQDGNEELERPLGDVSVTQLAFAPDSRYIAAFGYSDQFASGTIYIIDTQSGEVRPIFQLGDIKSLVWSPDGQSLAFIGRNAPPQFNDEVVVIRSDTGEVTYRSSVDVLSNNNSPEWPPLKWGVDFPVEMGGLGKCSLPPQN
jgi:RNA polymerase sigma factor (sigma-70 family)